MGNRKSKILPYFTGIPERNPRLIQLSYFVITPVPGPDKGHLDQVNTRIHGPSPISVCLPVQGYFQRPVIQEFQSVSLPRLQGDTMRCLSEQLF